MSITANHGYQHLERCDVKHVKDHVRHLRRRALKERTISERVSYLGRLAFSHPGVPFFQMTTEQIEMALDLPVGRDGTGISPRSRITYLSNIRGFYKWALADGRCTFDPAALAVTPKVPPPQARPVPESTYSDLIRSAPTVMFRCWLLLAGGCGLRAMEISRLRWEDIDFEESYLTVKGKGDLVRTVPMIDEVREAVEDHYRRVSFDPSEYVFRDPCLGTPYAPNRVSRIVNDWLDQTGHGKYTIHQLRHRFGTELLDVTGNHRLVQALLGHASIESLQTYTHVRSSRKVEAINEMRRAA